MSSPSAPSISRRSSLAERISSAIPSITRLPSLRHRKSTVSVDSVHATGTMNGSARNGSAKRGSTKHRPYSVHNQNMNPPILRDPSATSKFLDAIIDVPSGRRALARLARTCKAFQEPALDLLWKDLDSLTPLIALFPSTLLKRARRPGLGLTKNPEPEDWSRLLANGDRVRSVSYVEASGAISPSIFPIFEELRPRQWLLPNLTSLTWRSETAAGLERCRLFLGPELQSLTLEVGTKHPRLNDLLKEVASHSKLSSLSFTLHTNLPDAFTDIFSNNVALQRVALTAPGALGPKVGKWVATLPALRTLELDLSGRNPTAVEGFFDDIAPGSGYSTPSSVTSGSDSGVFSGDELDFSELRKSAVRVTRDGPRLGAFPQLTQLQLTGEVANIATFLRHLQSPLTQLELVIEDPPALDDWKDVCALICDEFAYTLVSLRVGATSASRFSELVRTTSRGGDVPLRHLPLTHLSALPKLQRLDIDLPESVVFTNGDVAHIAAACPALEILRLCAQARFPAGGVAPSLTLEGLAPLTARCQRLHTLAVVVNALEGSPATLGTRAVSSRALLRLGVGHSWIRDSLHAVVLLSHLAPYLESVKWFHEKNRTGSIEANALLWQKVSEFLPPIQELRLLERTLQPPPAPYVPPPSAEKAIDATVVMVDHSVEASPDYANGGVQAEVEVADFGVQMEPETTSVSIDATPEVVDEEVVAEPEVAECMIDATPAVEERGIDSIVPAEHEVASSDSDDESVIGGRSVPMLPFIPSAANGLITFTFRVVRFYTSPIRYMFSFMPAIPLYSAGAHIDMEPKSPGPEVMHIEDGHENDTEKARTDELELLDISPDAVYDYDRVVPNKNAPSFADEPDKSNAPGSKCSLSVGKTGLEAGAAGASAKHVSDVRWGQHADVSATRQSGIPVALKPKPLSPSAPLQITRPLPALKYTMAEVKKQEHDYTKEVDELLPEARSLAQAGKLQDSLDKLLVLEKQARNASDANSTTRLVKESVELCYTARDYALLNSTISSLSKKHGQLKVAIQAMVEQAMGWLEEVRKREGDEKWLELIETLRNVTEGKIFLETPRARVTLILAQYHEALAKTPTKTSPPLKESLQTASDLLSDLQVETYSSMERREKTEFLLEQMRLLIMLARQKDTDVDQEGKKDSIGGGEAEWVKVRVGGRKVNENFLTEEKNEDLKLKFYDMMIQYSLKQSAYLEAAKHYHKVWETPSIKQDVNGRGREALEHIVYYVVLAPYDNEQSDMLHRLFNDPALIKLELHYALVKCFTTPELMRWPGIQDLYGPHLRKTSVFSDVKLWEDLHTRFIEHNIRIVSQYYTRITLPRLTSLLDLTPQQAEETLCRLVVSGTVWARIDRPAGIVNFRSAKSAEDVMNDWSSDMQRLLGLVEKTWMGVNAAQAAQSRAVKA